MGIAVAALNWLAAAVFALAAYAMVSLGGRYQALFLAIAALLLLPPLRSLIHSTTGLSLPWWWRGLMVLALITGVVAVTVLNPATSIYKSPEVEAEFHRLYAEKLAAWPVPHEDIFVETRYGAIHVIASGPADAPPVLLIHASGVAAWSWITNIAALAADHRVYAIDNIGEVGLNRQTDVGTIPRDGPAIAAFYSEISDKLGIMRADVIGASIGGYIATSYALHAPERVRKLVLLGAMGYGNTNRTVLAMILAQAFPLPPVQAWALRWALGDDARIARDFGPWFRLVLNGSVPNPIPPTSLTPDRLSGLKVPTLAFFGTRDTVIGDAETAAALARAIPDIAIEFIDSGHLIAVEAPEIVNPRIAAFLAD